METPMVWVSHRTADKETLNEWPFENFPSERPTVFHLLQQAVAVFNLPPNDASVQIQFQGNQVNNRALLSSFESDPETGCLHFEIVHLTSLPATAYLSPIDFTTSQESNDEAMVSEIVYLEDEHLLVNNLVFDELLYNSCASKYIPVTGTLGNTGAGKSLILAALLGRGGFRLPVVRRAGQRGSTTANCNLFHDEKKDNIYLDFEGECGTEPCNLRKNHIQQNLGDIRKRLERNALRRREPEERLRFPGKKKKEKSNGEEKLELYYSQKHSKGQRSSDNLSKSKEEAEVKKLTRRDVVSKLLPKLAYLICDTLLYVTTSELRSDYSVYERCVSFAMQANEFVQDSDRPALVIVHNKFNVPFDNIEKELDVNESTRAFLETFDPKLKLPCYFSQIYVVRLPMIGGAYDNAKLRALWDQQMERLHNALTNSKFNRSQHRVTMGCQLTNKLWFRFVKVIVDELVHDKPISAARHLQDIIHMEFKEDLHPLISLFNKVYFRKPRCPEWYYQCARFIVDTLGRLWGIKLHEGGYTIGHNEAHGNSMLRRLLDSLNGMKPCTAVHPSKKLACRQTRALHVCHRSNFEDKSTYRRVLAMLAHRGATFTWDGEFTFDSVNEDQEEQLLVERFWTAANSFATNDTVGIQHALQIVVEHPDYRSCIWDTLLMPEWDADHELRSWAKRLVLDSMRLLDIRMVDNVWERAVADWEYLNILCCCIEHHHVTLGRTIEEGRFGEVYEGTFYESDKSKAVPCAVKVVRSSVKGFRVDAIRQEIAVMALIDERSVLKLYGYSKFQNRHETVYYLIVELMDQSLESFIRDFGHPQITPTEALEILTIASQVAEGIQTLHNHNIIHRDIKPGNILLRKAATGYQAVVSDLGLARLVDFQAMTCGVGTRGYIAPEVYEGTSNYDQKADVFSFGKVLEDLLQCLTPATDAHECLKECESILQQLVKRCCDPSPEKRVDIIHVLYRLYEQVLQISQLIETELPSVTREPPSVTEVPIKPPKRKSLRRKALRTGTSSSSDLVPESEKKKRASKVKKEKEKKEKESRTSSRKEKKEKKEKEKKEDKKSL